MDKKEILCTSVGEMQDMISCMAIENGLATQKPPKRTMDYDEAIALR